MIRILPFLVITLFISFTSASLKVKVESTPYGPIFYPNDGRTAHPGVIVFHGSEGGGKAFNQLEAQFLAMHGFAALAHCYFQCTTSLRDYSSPQMEFIDLPIEGPYEAFKWLKESKYTRGKKTGIVGTSKGAELAFLVASIASEEGLVTPDAIAAHAVSDSAEIGFSWNWYNPICWMGSNRADAKWNLACGSAPPQTNEGFKIQLKPDLNCYSTPEMPREKYSFHSWTWRGTHGLIRTHEQIPLEKFKDPIFFTHGTEDNLWCVSKAEAMRDRLQKHGLLPEVHIFKGEGHNFRGPAEEKRMELLIDFLSRSLN